MEGFKAQTGGIEKEEAARALRRGLCPHFGTKEEVGSCF